MTVSVQLEAKVRNPKGLKRLIDLVGLQTVADLMGERLAAWIVKNFEDEGTEQKWKALAPSTLAFRKHGGSKPLQDTGAMKRYVAEPTGRWLQGNVLNVGWRGEIAKIAGYHHYGSGPFEIRAVKAGVLAAQRRGGAWVVFGKVVHHPGIVRRPLLPTATTAESMMVNFMNAAIERALNGSA